MKTPPSTGVAVLRTLEQSGQFVFHGSPNGTIKVLKPKQGRHIPNLKNPTHTIPDGKPAISATPYAELAVFRAIINNENIPIRHHSGFEVSNGKKRYYLSSKEALLHAKKAVGYVYVLDKDAFVPYSRSGKATTFSIEWRSSKARKPILKIRVTYSDLKKGIEITGW